MVNTRSEQEFTAAVHAKFENNVLALRFLSTVMGSIAAEHVL